MDGGGGKRVSTVNKAYSMALNEKDLAVYVPHFLS